MTVDVTQGKKITGETASRPPRVLFTLIALSVIVIVAALLISLIYASQPSVQQEDAVKKTAMLVSVAPLQSGLYTPTIESLGQVQAARDIVLSPRVSGQVVMLSDNLLPGSLVEQGEVLLQIDPADYRNAVQQANSTLQQAQSALAIEIGRGQVAAQEYASLQRELGSSQKALVLRKPQLAAAEAVAASAQAALNQATLALDRTSVQAPFAAQVITRSVNLGSQVTDTTAIARLTGIDEYWVIATVPVAQLHTIRFPDEGNPGSRVTISNRNAWPADSGRHGEVIRLIGALDNTTRLARVLVSVKDPLALEDKTVQPMLVDSIVQVSIEGSSLGRVFRIPRDYLHEGDTVWLNRADQLHIAEVSVLFKDKTFAYVTDGLNDGDLMITSRLATVAEGLALRTDTE